jgi:hypothetical protein
MDIAQLQDQDMIPSTHRHQKPTHGKSSPPLHFSLSRVWRNSNEMGTDNQLAQLTGEILRLEILRDEAAALVALRRIFRGQETIDQETL